MENLCYRANMPQHKVKLIKTPEVEIGKADVEFTVGSEDAKLGTLLVSKGGIEWRPFKKQKRHISREKFDEIIRKHWND